MFYFSVTVPFMNKMFCTYLFNGFILYIPEMFLKSAIKLPVCLFYVFFFTIVNAIKFENKVTYETI